MRGKRLVVANWKMNPKTLAEAKKLFLGVKRVMGKVRGARTVVCPPVAFLAEIRKYYIGKRIMFGAQDVHTHKSGAFTGSVSAPMLRSIGATYVIVGHSERRASGEANNDIQKKVRAALDERLVPILCVGERERDQSGAYVQFVREEIESALRGVAKDELRRVVIAYEPIWAIGGSSADAMNPHDMHQMSLFIKKVLTEAFDRDVTGKVPVLYGGSVEPENCKALMEDGDINGFLVGHASLDPTAFGDILANTHGAR